MYQNDPMKVLTGECRLSYCNLTTPRAAQQGGEPKYSVTLLIPKTDVATKADIDAAIQAAANEALSKVWNGARPPQLRVPIYDGDGVRPSGVPFGDECKGHWVMTASTKNKPQVVGIDNINCELAPSDIYSGMYARVTIRFFGYSNKLIEDFVAAHPDIELVSERVDDGYSGVLFDRPAFQEMMNDIVSGKINCVIVKDLSRLGREYIETGRYLRQVFPTYGVRFISINDGIDTANEQNGDDLHISKEEFQEAQGVADNALMLLSTATKHRDSLQKEHATFRKLLSTSDKEIPLSEIMGYVDKIVVDDGKQLMVKWRQSKPYWGEPYELDKFSDI